MKRSNGAMSWNAWDVSTALFPVLRVFSVCSDKQRGVHGGKYLLTTPGNGISEILNSECP